MNWDQIEGKWKEFGGRFREKWGKLTNDDWDVIAGKRDQLVGKIQQRYGVERERAQQEVDEFVRAMQPESGGAPDETAGTSGKARRAGQP